MSFMEKIAIGGSGEQKEENEQHHHHHQYHHQQPFFSPPLYNHHLCEPSSNQKEETGVWTMVEREHMFDKVVTPSDVGKLNRLVIPKQHAERYFPLDSSTNYKGLLLNFEDRNGKLWRFQYSYWNSSQSYVMTKGWSRFVKEKKLDAGDVVSFQRGVGVTAKDRLFIDWRRRVNPSSPPHQFHNHNFIHPWNQVNPLVLQSLPARRNPNFMLQAPTSNLNFSTSSRSVYFGPDGFRAPQQQFKMMERSELQFGFGLGFDPPPPVEASNPPVNYGKASGKRLRLFGVNMDCVFSDDEDDHPLIPSSSSSFSTIPYLQLTPFGQETECNESRMVSASSTHDFNIMAKSTASSMLLDLKMSHTEAEI